MAYRAGISVAEAQEMIQLHKQLYRRFWEYSGAVVDSAMISNRLSTVFGWQRWVKATDKPTSLMNFPMQANGAEMMRIAAIAATEAGIELCTDPRRLPDYCAPGTARQRRSAHVRDHVESRLVRYWRASHPH